jgi:predicted RND superfamily exporter protein
LEAKISNPGESSEPTIVVVPSDDVSKHRINELSAQLEQKQKEIEYYDKKTEELLDIQNQENDFRDFEGFKPQILASFKFVHRLLKENCKDKIIF